MTRAPCGGDEKADGLKKGPWTPDEDEKLVAYIQKHGHGSWRSLPLNAGLQRCGKSCRLRWTNYLRPDIKRGRFSLDEDQMIVHLHAILGNRWSAIASHLPRRTDNEIKNYWNTHLKKRLVQMGIDPVTHKSTIEEQLVLDSIIPGLRPVVSSNLTHMSQWDSFRAEAEARLSRQSSSFTTSSNFQQQTSKPLNESGSASTAFMSFWKAQVAETLRPSFGVVELDKPGSTSHPVNFQAFLQDWEWSLQARGPTFSTCDSPIDVPDLSSGTPSGAVSPHYDAQGSHPVFPSSAQITERLLGAPRCSSFEPDHNIFAPDSDSQSFAGVCGDSESQFSPTSTLHDYDSSYTNSPCNSKFNVLGHAFESTEQSKVHHLMFPQAAASFWSRQQVAMADAGFSFNGAAEANILNLVEGMPNSVPIPQFDSLM